MDTVLKCLSDSNLNRSVVNGRDAQCSFQQLRADSNRIVTIAVKQKQAEKTKENKTQNTPPISTTTTTTNKHNKQKKTTTT